MSRSPDCRGSLRFQERLGPASPGLRTIAAIGMLGAFLSACAPDTDQPPAAPSEPSAQGVGTSGATGAPTDGPTKTGLRFTDGTAASGIDFVHLPTYTEERYMPEIQGGGVAIIDVNRDGAPDVLAVNSGELRSDTRPPGGSSRLYLNDGAGRFTDVSEQWGLEFVEAGYGMGVAVGDVDGNGWPDIFLTVYDGDDRLLLNDGSTFIDATGDYAIQPDPRWSTSAGFLDIENDGDLDLYIARYSEYDLDTAERCYEGDLHIYCTPHLVDAIADRLLRNEGGTFLDVSDEAGLGVNLGRGLALVIGDIDQDGDVDIYVANDLNPNNLWLNDGSGRFEDVAPRAGVAVSVQGIAEAGMGADMGDVDGDGTFDLVTTNFEGETTTVHLQSDDLTFREVSDSMGVGKTARARLKWGIDLFDADNDGDEDLIVANGHIYDNAGEFSGGPTFPQQNTLYENIGAGEFVDVSDISGTALLDRQVSRGLVTSDLDGDGDLDAIIVNNGGTLQVLINESVPTGNWIGLWLEGAGQGTETSAGPGANTSAIGARVQARIGDVTLLRQVTNALSYLSAGDLRVHLGLGDADVIDELVIHWPGGGVQTIEGLAAGSYYRVFQGMEPEPFVPGERVIAP